MGKRKACQMASQGLKSPPNNLNLTQNPNIHSFKSWNIKKVQNWLNSIGLEEYLMFFQANKIDGTRLSRISSDFLDSIGMLDVDKTVFYLELQKLYGKSSPVKLKLGKHVKTKKVVTVTENTRVVFKNNGTLVIKTGPEIKKVEIVQNSDETPEEIDHETHSETHSEKPDKSYLMNKYLEKTNKTVKKLQNQKNHLYGTVS